MFLKKTKVVASAWGERRRHEAAILEISWTAAWALLPSKPSMHRSQGAGAKQQFHGNGDKQQFYAPLPKH